MKAALVLGTQLFRDHPALSDPDIDIFIMIEAEDACRRLPYHQQRPARVSLLNYIGGF